MAKKQSKASRNTAPPPAPAKGKSVWDWSKVTTNAPILMEDGKTIPKGVKCSATGGPHGPLELTPDDERWPIIGDIPTTAVLPARAK